MCSKPFSTLLSSFWGRLRSAITVALGRSVATNTPTSTTATSSAASAEGKQEGTFRLQEILTEVLKEPQFVHIIVDPRTSARIAIMMSIPQFEELVAQSNWRLRNFETKEDMEEI